MTDVTLNDVVLDLVPVLEEAADSGRLVGSESTTIEKVDTDGYIDRREHMIVLTLSDGTRVELDVSVVEA